MAGCELITGGETQNDTTDTVPANEALLGTWEGTTVDTTHAARCTFAADGTFVALESNYDGSGFYYSALKGTYEVDSAGTLTLKATQYAYPGSFNLEGVIWSDMEHPLTVQGSVLVIENKLYVSFLYTAQGPWTQETMLKEPDNGTYDTKYRKSEVIFSTDGTFTSKGYGSNTVLL